MATKETANSKRLKEEKRLENFSELGLTFNEDRGALNEPFKRSAARMVGKADDGYGTSRSAGAKYAAGQQQDAIWRKGNVTVGESADDPSVRQARREAAAEERRESRGMKRGGKVKKMATGGAVKGAGAAIKGVRKCKMV
jgi:hypothetical protein